MIRPAEACNTRHDTHITNTLHRPAEEGAAKIRLDLAGSLAVGPLLCNEAVHTVERISLYMKMCKTINNHKRRNTRNVHTRQVAYE